MLTAPVHLPPLFPPFILDLIPFSPFFFLPFCTPHPPAPSIRFDSSQPTKGGDGGVRGWMEAFGMSGHRMAGGVVEAAHTLDLERFLSLESIVRTDEAKRSARARKRVDW